MRYLVFSDIHGNSLAFDQFLIDIKNTEYDKLVFLGDFLGYYYEPEKIIDYCMSNDVVCLLGNHDQYFLQMLDGAIEQNELVNRYGHSYAIAKETISKRSVQYLRTLDSSLAIKQAEQASVLFCHGSPLDTLNGRIYPDTSLSPFTEAVEDFDFVICGHTHHKMIRKLGNTTFINPGSLGQQRDGRGCSYLSIDTITREFNFHVISYDIAKLESLIDQHDNGNQRFKSVLRRTPAS